MPVQPPSARLPVAQQPGRSRDNRTGRAWRRSHISNVSMLMGGPREQGKNHRQAVLALARRRVDVVWALIRDRKNSLSTGTGDPRRGLNQTARRRRNPIVPARPTLPTKINWSHMETPPADANPGEPVPTRVTAADRRSQTGVRVLRACFWAGKTGCGEGGRTRATPCHPR